MEETVYDLCIVGAGMFGSAAARHASANVGTKICLVGPEEPTTEERLTREIFGAHYDEGRITRTLDPNVSCQILARNSINRYRKLEDLSGINFYTPVGLLYITKQKSSELGNLLQAASSTNLSVTTLSHDIFKNRFPYIKLKSDDYPLLDYLGAGHISPRKMVSAQKKVAEIQGCDVINKVVNEVKPLINGIHEIITEEGETIKAKRVLICTGAFTNMKKFPIPKLLTKLMKETAALFKLSKEEAERLSSMPSIIYTGPKIGVYILPPIQYPDGNFYLKIGQSYPKDESDCITTLDEIKTWYLSKGESKKIENTRNFLTEILPGLSFDKIKAITCVTSDSPSGLPYIDRVTPTVTVAAIANGRGAKFSDEVGRIAATLSLTGKWDSELPESNFRFMSEN